MRRAYTALAALAAPEDSDPPHPQPPWILIKRRRGQLASEIYLFASAVAALTFAFSADALRRSLPGDAPVWHWLWIVPAGIALQVVGLHLATIASHVLGCLLGKVGILRGLAPARRTSFCFLAALTTCAAAAAGSGRPLIAWPGTAWLALVAANLVAAVILAMRSAERPRHRTPD
ncbi:hypothetical protein BH23VER1_BH23VER1_28230 [soil metagenome]